jgi:hypothetical protein
MSVVTPANEGKYHVHERIPTPVHAEKSPRLNPTHLWRNTLRIGGCSSGVERLLPKQNVVSSNLITRSIFPAREMSGVDTKTENICTQ